MNRMPINVDNVQYETLEAHQCKYNRNDDTHKIHPVLSAGSTVAVQWEDGGTMGNWKSQWVLMGVTIETTVTQSG